MFWNRSCVVVVCVILRSAYLGRQGDELEKLAEETNKWVRVWNLETPPWKLDKGINSWLLCGDVSLHIGSKSKISFNQKVTNCQAIHQASVAYTLIWEPISWESAFIIFFNNNIFHLCLFLWEPISWESAFIFYFEHDPSMLAYVFLAMLIAKLMSNIILNFCYTELQNVNVCNVKLMLSVILKMCYI